jgi:MFS family permease
MLTEWGVTGAFFPLVIYYQTQFYRRGELGRRLAIFYAASNIAYAFGGLLAFGTFQIHGGSLANWRYLFALEGSLTICMAIVAFIFLPYSAAHAKFLTEDEKKLALYRMQVDSSSVVNEPFVFRDAIAILKEPTSWVILAIEICLGVPLQGVALFLPQIIARLGYATVKTNLYTVAPNITGAVMLLILGFASDYTRWRFPFVALGFFFTFTGFVIYAAIDVEKSLHVAYFACFIMTWSVLLPTKQSLSSTATLTTMNRGTSAPSVLLDVLYNNNIANEGRRVLLTSIGIPLANLMGLVPSNVFRNQDAPDYIPALVTTSAFGGMGIVLTLGLGAFMIFDNRRRDRKQGLGVRMRGPDVSTALMRDGPKSPDFRWYY